MKALATILLTMLMSMGVLGKGCMGSEELCKNGFGGYEYNSGDIYFGNWKNGNRHGQGKYTWASGSEYFGDWKYGVKHGEGMLTSAKGKVQNGVWRNGSYIGTKTEWDAKERARTSREERERVVREEVKKKYERIYNACLLDKSSGIDMQVNALRKAVEATCEDIAKNPSWWQEFKYN